jgi:hypothetical protein
MTISLASPKWSKPLKFSGGPAGNRTRMIGLEDQHAVFMVVQDRPDTA